MLAVNQYVQDYDERMPRHGNSPDWSDQIYPYVKNVQLYNCPSSATRGPASVSQLGSTFNYSWNYYSNGGQNNMALAQIQRPSEALVILDGDYYISNPWRGDGGSIDNEGVPRHNDGANIGWADGHGKWMKPTNYVDVRYWDWDRA